MKLQAELGDEKLDLEIRREGDRLFANVGGREYDLEVSEPEPGVFLIKNGAKITEVFVSPAARPGGPVQVHAGGASFEVRLTDPKRLRGSGAGSDHAHGAAEMRTAMPGKVVKILLEPGAEVAKGDGVMVVEAMKMQNELKAPKSGTLKDVLVEEGATVSAGQILATIE